MSLFHKNSASNFAIWVVNQFSLHICMLVVFVFSHTCYININNLHNHKMISFHAIAYKVQCSRLSFFHCSMEGIWNVPILWSILKLYEKLLVESSASVLHI